MVLRNATPEETEAWLGSGLVIFGLQPAPAAGERKVAAEPSTHSQAAVPDAGQEQHDHQMAAMSDQEMNNMVRKLALLARSKLGMDNEMDNHGS